MKKIAIILDGSLTDRKGLVNAALYRASYLKRISQDYQIDVYNFQGYDNTIVRKLRHTKRLKRYSEYNVEGLNIKVFWYSSTLLDYILGVRFKRRPFIQQWAYRLKLPYFRKYDLISAHSTKCGLLAYYINKKYNIPFCITWHGSDIHTSPFNNEFNRKDTIKIIESAKFNFFVSKSLLDISERLTTLATKTILYNGVGPSFMKYEDDKRHFLRRKYGLQNKQIVCFAGNVIDIKNPMTLPEIFNSVNRAYDGELCFWIIGDGKLRPLIEQRFIELGLEYKCWGNINADFMVDYLNCVDVLVLPSKNEGLPLITVEALKCGANVVGSNVGGISEVIGMDNVFDINDDFIYKISGRIVEMLSQPILQPLDNKFDWMTTAKKEYEIYQKILNQTKIQQ